MCGIAGILNRAPGGRALDLRGTVVEMATRVAHRGPDDSGAWADEAAGVAIAQRRLAIIDLTPEGHQPMISACGRYVIVFNGEIYNYRDLRAELLAAGVVFHGHSDTEVLLEGMARWGIDTALRRANGMFALALWDRQQRRLTLARDRFGQKPLYYGWCNGHFLFGSELKALASHPAFTADIDRNASLLYLRHGWIPAPHTIYRGIRKLPAGMTLNIEANDQEERSLPVAYWSAVEAARAARENPFTGTLGEAVDEADTLLRSAVSQCMIADVPLGAFLSGGIDSSTVVALMKAASGGAVRTFSIGFRDDQYDEAVYARRVAQHLGTEHTEIYLTEADALGVIPQLGAMYDEPFADSSQIPTHLISRVARRDVTVALSGDGGDEMFGGYSRYHWAQTIERGMRTIPGPVRRLAAGGIRAVPVAAWDAFADGASALLPSRLRYTQAGDKLNKLADLIEVDSAEALYRQLVSTWPRPDEIVSGATEPPTALNLMPGWSDLSLPAQMMLLDTLLYLPDDILAKVDRASMAVSLEVRVPFLDHRIFEFAWRLPEHYRVGGGSGKIILREILKRYVPRELIERPKMGFAVPIARWLRGELRDWSHDLLKSSSLMREGILDPAPIWKAWEEHVQGRRNWQHRLWSILMFETWLATNRPGGTAREALSGAAQ